MGERGQHAAEAVLGALVAGERLLQRDGQLARHLDRDRAVEERDAEQLGDARADDGAAGPEGGRERDDRSGHAGNVVRAG